MLDIEAMAADVIDASIRIHRELGPGLLESVYETVLASQLARNGYRVERQRPISFDFDGLHFEGAFRIDILVEDRLLIEINPSNGLTPCI